MKEIIVVALKTFFGSVDVNFVSLIEVRNFAVNLGWEHGGHNVIRALSADAWYMTHKLKRHRYGFNSNTL